MKKIKLNELMKIERLLLEINVKFKFELSFNDAYILHTYLSSVGKITNYFFLIQDEFHQKYNDVNKLKEYHNKLMNDPIEFDCDKIIEFIEKITKTYEDKEFQALMDNVKFWE